jgi:hypothetical protein
VETPEWTDEDRAALLGLQMYESTLCAGCGEPKHTAWQVNGWYKAHSFVCDACTAMTGEGDQRKDQTYTVAYLEPGTDLGDLPPLQIGTPTSTHD